MEGELVGAVTVGLWWGRMTYYIPLWCLVSTCVPGYGEARTSVGKERRGGRVAGCQWVASIDVTYYIPLWSVTGTGPDEGHDVWGWVRVTRGVPQGSVLDALLLSLQSSLLDRGETQ